MYNRQQLVGQWHRSGKGAGHSFSEIAVLNSDGSFTFTFYTYNLDGVLESEITELGDWGLVGDIHFTITKEEIENNTYYTANNEDPDNYHAYKVVSLSNDNFSYQHIVTGEIYTLDKVNQRTN